MLTSTDGTAAQRSAPKGGVADAKREPGGPWRPRGDRVRQTAEAILVGG